MEKCTIPGSPNWYLSQAFDCSYDNKVAYGSLSSLVILDPLDKANPVTINHAHSLRILSVSFPPEGFGKKLLSTSEAGEVFVWDLESQKATLTYRNPQKCSTYGSWSHANGNIIVSVDETGNLIQWKVESNVVSTKHFKEHSFVVVACCPHDQSVVATGTKHGLVCVINIKVTGKESILHQLRGHDSELVSLSWCPVPENVFHPKNNSRCLLLASGAKEKRIFFWRAGQDGLYEAYADVPFAPRIVGVKPWTCVCWNEPQQLLVSTTAGEVLSTNLSNLKSKKSSEKGQKWDTFSLNHNRGHVVVKSSPWPVKKEISGDDWRVQETAPRWVWTFGSDRVVAGTCSDVQVSPIKLNTLGGAINALTISSIDGTSLAIGGADKSIRVVNLSEPQLKSMQTYSQKVSGKVMSLAWHPSKDGWLAYGTSDGRIGIQYTCVTKPPLLFRPFSKESIYSMEWGPSFAEIKTNISSGITDDEAEAGVTPSNYVLYAIGGGKIAAMDPIKPDHIFEDSFKNVLKPVLKSESLKIKHKVVNLTDLAWKPDYTLLAVGDETGSVHLLNLMHSDDFQLVASFKVHSKLIQDLSWHPLCCSLDESEVSPLANWLACASNEESIQILDTSSIFDALCNPEEVKLPLSNVPSVATLKGHKLRVSKLAWSPHEGGRLLSVSYDQCAEVWDVINKQPIACFARHSAPLFCCLWSPLNPSFGITAGQDGTICVWDVREQLDKLPIEKSRDGKKLTDGAKEAKALGTAADNATLNGESTSKKSANKKREKATLPLSGPEINKDDGNLAILRCLLRPPDSGNIELNLEGEENSKKMPLHYAFFGEQSVVEQYLMAEAKIVTKENSFTLDVWRGSTKDAITEAIQTKTLDSYLVSIAPTVSHKLWVEACAAFAEQLKEANEHSKASVYLLAIHKVEDAIRLLADQGKFRHALAIARCRLLPDDPLIKGLLNDWAQECLSEGRQCLAAVCFASGGEWARAAQALAFKKCPKRLLLAAEIIKKKCDDNQTGNFYARQCFDVSLSLRDWHSAQSVLMLYSNLNHLALRLHVHEAICTFEDTMSPADWLKLSGNKETCREPEDAINITISLTKEKVCALQRDLVNEVTVNSSDTAWLASSSKVTLAFLTAPTLFPKITNKFVIDEVPGDEGIQRAYRYLVQAMSLLNDTYLTNMLEPNHVPILLKFCMWLAPQGPFGENSIFSSPQFPLQNSLRAHLAAGLLLWLLKSISLDKNVRSLALDVIDVLKRDIFSAESLTWFKVQFQLDVLQKAKEKEVTLKKACSKAPQEDVSSDPSQQMQDLSLRESNGKDGVLVDSSSTTKDANEREDNQLDKLKKVVQEFVEAREVVPNPYLSYSHLSQYLNVSADTVTLDKYSALWKEITSNLI